MFGTAATRVKNKPTDFHQLCVEQKVEAALLSADLLFLPGESFHQPDWIITQCYQGIHSSKEV